VKADDEIRKSFETIVHLKTPIEKYKRIEELLNNQINEKEELCCKLEAEIVDLIKKVENSNKFLNISLILDEILESQRSPYDKLGLGYKGEDTHVEASTSKKHEVNPSKKEDIKKLFLGHQRKGMKVFFKGIFIHVMDMVTKLLNVDLMKGDIMEDFITP
jgi:hypothetical protein